MCNQLSDKFAEIKGNCSDLVMTDRADHCDFHGDDCEEALCPHMKFDIGIETYGDTQCPMCGSVVMSEDIEVRRSSINEFPFGMGVGLAVAASIVAILLMTGAIKFAGI